MTVTMAIATIVSIGISMALAMLDKNGSRIRVNTPCQKYDPVVCSKAPWLSMSQVGEQVIASMSSQMIAAILAAK